MSLYALTLSGVQRLKRQMFGTKITDKDGNPADTAVQPFVNELVAALSDKNAINLPSPLLFNAPAGNGPSMIINRFVLDQTNVDNSGNQTTNINGGTIRFVDQNGNFIDVPGGNTGNINVTTTIGGGGGGTQGFTGTQVVVTAITGASVSVSGCTATLTVSVSTVTFTFKNGLCLSIA